MKFGTNRKPRMLVLSHVLPFPRSSGQQQRVFYTLQAARETFELTFATPTDAGEEKEVRRELSELCHEVVLLPSMYSRSKASKLWHRTLGAAYATRTALKLSNYIVGQLEFSPDRVNSLLDSRTFDCVLYEYWHAVDSVSVFRGRGIPCILDMHNILWQSFVRQLDIKPWLPRAWKRRAIEKYSMAEERAWKEFDGLIAINREEQRYVEAKLARTNKIFYAPMGVDLTLWPYSWKPVKPLRVAYYGGLGNAQNQQGALRCFNHIMPEIWRRFPETELWLVGSNPPESLRTLSHTDSRVKLTGYVKDVQQVLRGMSAVICPWSGIYGFRSRLIEVMALGVPLVTTNDAVYGMDLENGKGLFLGEDDKELSELLLKLLDDETVAQKQSHLARQQAEQLYNLDNTYGKLMNDLYDWLQMRESSVK